MALKTWLTHGDDLYKKQHFYDATREWEGAFTRAFRTLSQTKNYQEVASELVKRLQWLQSSDKHHDAELLTKKLFNILQKIQKDEKDQLHFFTALIQEIMRAENDNLIFLISKSLLDFSIQHATSLEHEATILNEIVPITCQKVLQASLYTGILSEYFVSTWRFILFILLTRMQFNKFKFNRNDPGSFFDACFKAFESLMMSEHLDPSEKIVILVEFTLFLSLLDPNDPQIRKCLSLLKELSQKYKDIGKRQHANELRENLVLLIQSIRQEDQEAYFSVKSNIFRLVGTKNTLLPHIIKKMEQECGFKQNFSLFPF